jgi:hypothetical protein
MAWGHQKRQTLSCPHSLADIVKQQVSFFLVFKTRGKNRPVSVLPGSFCNKRLLFLKPEKIENPFENAISMTVN